MKRALTVLAASSLFAACAGKPPPAPPPAPAPPPVASSAAVAPPSAPTTPDDDFRKAPPKLPPRTTMVAPAVDDGKLTNGVRVAVVERHQAPVIALEIAIARPMGVSAAARDLMGAMLLTTPSTGGMSARDALEGAGAAFVVETNVDATRFAVTTTPEALDCVLAVVADVLAKPAFAKDTLETHRDVLIKRAERNATGDELHAFLDESVLPAGHPYRARLHADVADTKKVTLADATRAAQTSLKPDAITIVAVGDVTRKDLADKLETKLAAWKGKSAPLAKAPDKLAKGVFVGDVAGEREVELAIAVPAAPRASRDYAALFLLHQVITAELWDRLRQRGDALPANASMQSLAYPGLWWFAVRSSPGGAVGAIEAVLAELSRMERGEISTETLERARARQVALLEAKLDRSPDAAFAIVELLGEHVGAEDLVKLRDRLLSISKDELRTAAQTYLKRDEVRVAMIGDVGAKKKELEALKLGPVNVKKIVRPKATDAPKK